MIAQDDVRERKLFSPSGNHVVLGKGLSLRRDFKGCNEI